MELKGKNPSAQAPPHNPMGAQVRLSSTSDTSKQSSASRLSAIQQQRQ